MNMFIQITLIFLIVNIAAVLILLIIWRNKETKFAKFILAGSTIYRDLPMFIKKDKNKVYLALSYTVIILFFLLVVELLFTT